MSKRQFNTLTGFLTSKSSNPSISDTVEFQGYDVIGDGGNATWQHHGITGETPSKSPAQLGVGLLNDGNGNQWGLVSRNDIDPQALGAIGGAESTLSVQAALNTLSEYGVMRSNNSLPFIVGNLTVPATEGITVGKGLYSLSALADSAMFEGTSLDSVRFTKLTLDGNASNQNPLATEGNSIRALIKVSGAGTTDISIIGNKLSNSSGAGIAIDDGEGTVITRNKVDSVFGHGIQCAGDTLNAIISNNKVSNVDEGAGVIPMGNAKFVNVSNNIIDTVNGDGGDGITCYSDTNENIIITGNVIKNINGHGIHTGGINLTVNSNNIINTTAGGVYVTAQTIQSRDVSVTGNTIDNATTNVLPFGRHGIHLNNVSGFTTGLNTVVNGQDSGIRLKACAVGTVSDNTISSSIVNGIRSEISGERINYIGNTIKDTGGSAMLFDNESQSSISNNIIENYATVDASAFGIEVTSGIVLVITGNHIRQGTGTLAPATAGFSGAQTLSKVKDNIITDGTSIQKGLATVGVTSTIPAEYDYIVFNGASAVTTIDTVTSYDGREITIQCAGGVSFTDSTGNLRLSGDFAPSGSTATIRLVLNGANWLELSRSQN